MIIVKVGGGTAAKKSTIAKDLKNFKQKVVFVHGARRQADQVAKQLGFPTKRVKSPSGMTSIFTDPKAMEIMTMVYSGLVNKQWIQAFQSQNINAVGLSGVDGKIWQGKRKTHLVIQAGKKQKLVSNTFTGKIEKINTNLIKLLLDNNYLPVITQPAISDQNQLINTDNDRNISLMAKDLNTKKLVILFEAPGLLKNPKDKTSLIRKIYKQDLSQMMQYAQGTMKKKILGAQEAFAHGVKKIYWSDSRINRPITNALAGKGTVVS